MNVPPRGKQFRGRVAATGALALGPSRNLATEVSPDVSIADARWSLRREPRALLGLRDQREDDALSHRVGHESWQPLEPGQPESRTSRRIRQSLGSLPGAERVPREPRPPATNTRHSSRSAGGSCSIASGSRSTANTGSSSHGFRTLPTMMCHFWASRSRNSLHSTRSARSQSRTTPRKCARSCGIGRVDAEAGSSPGDRAKLR